MKKLQSRRNFLKKGRDMGFAASSIVLSGGSLATADDFAADPSTIEKWMNSWIEVGKKPIGGLFVGRFKNPIYFLTKSITWIPNPGQEAFRSVTVPIGFVTDFASIPRAFWSLLRPDGNYTYPAIIHDFLYWTQDGSKDEADQILRFGMEDFQIDAVSLNAIYEGVHLFGGPSWDTNTRLRSQGERRILKQFPDDPTVTWEEWKKKDVFAESK
jgi:Protein of unknown function (DUF1353)